MDSIKFVLFIGCLFLFYKLYQFIKFCWMMIRCYLFTSFGFVNDLKKYGEWAVVTGATDGIGKEYARQLAKQGLNIVLISRTLSKLETVAKELKEEFKVNTRIVSFDFTQTIGYKQIREALSGLDIGILVNNVGTADKNEPFVNKDIDQLMDVVNLNVTSEVQMTHAVATLMVKRKSSLIIHIASSVLYYDLKAIQLSVYPATKAFMEKFWKTMKLEHEGIITHQLVTPYVVSTKLVAVGHTFHSPSAEDYVKSAIRTIGLSDETCGYWFMEIQKAICQHFPSCVANYMMMLQFSSFTFLKERMD